VVERGTLRGTDAVQSTTDQTENLIASAMGLPGQRSPGAGLLGALTGPAQPVTALVTPAEVSQAMAAQVRPTGGTGMAGGQMTTFVNEHNQVVLMIGTVSGLTGSMMMRSRRGSGAPLPGIGDEAYTGEGWALGRRGDTVIMLLTHGDGRRVPPGNLFWLLQTAVARLSAGAAV